MLTLTRRRIVIWLVSLPVAAVLALGGVMLVVSRTFARLGVEAQARLLARQRIERPGTREGDELACLNAALLRPDQETLSRWNSGEADDEGARWVDEVVACAELRSMTRSAADLLASQPPPRLETVATLARDLLARGPSDENAARCVGLLRLVADLSQLNEHGVRAREVIPALLTSCEPVLSGEARARQLEDVRARFVTNREYIEQLVAFWETQTFWPWIPPEAQRVGAPDLSSSTLLMRWDQARAVRRMHPLVLQLAEQADTPGPAREALSKRIDEAAQTWISGGGGPDLEGRIRDADAARAALDAAATASRTRAAPPRPARPGPGRASPSR